AASTGREFNRR
ncbi:IMV membrane protein A30, partial [Monkeypox virus]